jgi:hypothetical protein
MCWHYVNFHNSYILKNSKKKKKKKPFIIIKFVTHTIRKLKNQNKNTEIKNKSTLVNRGLT